MTRTALSVLADMLDADDVYDRLVDVMAEARDEAPRMRDEDGEPIDADSAVVLDAIIRTLRATR